MRKVSILLVILPLFSEGTILGAERDVIWTRTHDGINDYDFHEGLYVGVA